MTTDVLDPVVLVRRASGGDKSAWDELVDRHAPNRETAVHIKSNVLYQGLSEHFVGSLLMNF